jgi:tungstate transport system substrate-binding protein
MIMMHRFLAGVRAFGGLLCTFACAGFVLVAGCAGEREKSTDGLVRDNETTDVLRLATTTSTRDSGLLDELLPVFERSHNCRVDVIAVGTGAALRLGEAGDVDVLLIHARTAEEAFMAAGHGIRHEELMYNDFVLLGPKDDPAGVRGLDPIEAMRKIAESKQRFVSRGDDSGTHKRELSLWGKAGGRPAWDDYLEGGQGMGPTLMMAGEKQSYVLADRGTYLNFRDKISLVPLAAAAESLRNPYAVIAVSPQKHEKINSRLADALVDFLISDEAQRLIADYRISGQQLFYPTRIDGDN